MNQHIPFQIEPHSAEAEQQILGALLLDGSLVGSVVRAGGVDLFFDPVHSEIFRIAAAKDRAGDLVSPITVSAAMAEHPGLAELGGGRYLVRMAGASLGPSQFPGILSMLADQWAKRRLMRLIEGAQAAIVGGEEGAGQIAARLEAGLIEIEPQGGAGPVSMHKAVNVAIEQILAAYTGQDDGVVRSGIAALDKILPGFYPGELVLIGGRPSMGKTGVALSVALNVARSGHGVCIASLEMNPEAMAIRALSEQTAQQRFAVSYASMRQGDMNDDHVASLRTAAQLVAELPIAFLPRNYSDVGALIAGAKQVQRAMNGKMRLLIVDYAQLLKAEGRSRYDQITSISMALKSLAGQLNVPVIALSQLSRAVEQREDKRPVMADLRESGQLEQDADAVLFCYRDEYYLERERPAEDELDDFALWQTAMEKARNRLEIIVAKQRQGQIGTAHCRFNPALNLIWNEGER